MLNELEQIIKGTKRKTKEEGDDLILSFLFILAAFAAGNVMVLFSLYFEK